MENHINLVNYAVAVIITVMIALGVSACATPGGYVVGWENIHQVAKERRELELRYRGAPMDSYTQAEKSALKREMYYAK
jgi:hypothetical protein